MSIQAAHTYCLCCYPSKVQAAKLKESRISVISGNGKGPDLLMKEVDGRMKKVYSGCWECCGKIPTDHDFRTKGIDVFPPRSSRVSVLSPHRRNSLPIIPERQRLNDFPSYSPPQFLLHRPKRQRMVMRSHSLPSQPTIAAIELEQKLKEPRALPSLLTLPWQQQQMKV